MYDDQHGTAIITAAGLMNALEYISRMKIVVVGAGATGIVSAKMYRLLGAKHAVANAAIEDGVAQLITLITANIELSSLLRLV